MLLTSSSACFDIAWNPRGTRIKECKKVVIHDLFVVIIFYIWSSQSRSTNLVSWFLFEEMMFWFHKSLITL